MTHYIIFLIGVVVGANLGIILVGILNMAREDKREFIDKFLGFHVNDWVELLGNLVEKYGPGYTIKEYAMLVKENDK